MSGVYADQFGDLAKLCLEQLSRSKMLGSIQNGTAKRTGWQSVFH
jgi:hypothetical protein